MVSFLCIGSASCGKSFCQVGHIFSHPPSSPLWIVHARHLLALHGFSRPALKAVIFHEENGLIDFGIVVTCSLTHLFTDDDLVAMDNNTPLPLGSRISFQSDLLEGVLKPHHTHDLASPGHSNALQVIF